MHRLSSLHGTPTRKISFPNCGVGLKRILHQVISPSVIPALQEVDHVAPDCRQWLREKGVSPTPIDGTILSEAMNSKNLLGIVEQQFHPRGVDENDLIIISSATILGATLITNEARQLDLPDNPAKYKIPAVCDLIGLPWTDFTRLLRNNGGTFG